MKNYKLCEINNQEQQISAISTIDYDHLRALITIDSDDLH